MVVFYHLLVCPWISVEKIILTLTNFLYPFFLQFFTENSEIQDGCQDHMSTPFHKIIQKGFFSPSNISYLYHASEKSMIKPLLNFLQHGFQT
jgi:hypothetical protein